jgi:hypothetical protein
LQWATATENNNAYFSVEKTQDNIHYQSAAILKGSGTTNASHTYSTIDPNPFSGLSYYRLSQTDMDGHTTYFEAIPFQACENTPAINAFLNKNSDITVKINSPVNDTYTIEVINLVGQTIVSTTENVSSGMNQFTLPTEYSNGIYFVRVLNSVKTYSMKLLVLK